MHARLPKNFVLEERLERYASAIELVPTAYAGRWREACAPIGTEPFRELRLDLGCGKGAFLTKSARREPDVLFVGIDAEPLCIAYAAQAICEAEAQNAVVVGARGSQLPQLFGEGEVARITLNFPTPFPRKKDAARRLVILERLADYRFVLAPDGELRLKTDSQPLRDFALTQLELAGYELTWRSDDARSELSGEPASEYEQRLRGKGAPVFAVHARPAERPASTVQTAELSLAEYLPHDLANMGYVPHGMQGTVTNLRNRAIREGMRAGR